MAYQDGVARVDDVAQGLFDRANPLLITDGHTPDVRNVHFNRLSAEEAGGLRIINRRGVRIGAVRFEPVARRSSVANMTRWRDGHLVAPVNDALLSNPAQVDVCFRIEEDLFFPEGGQANVTPLYAGFTGRYQGGNFAVVGDQIVGGEHHFMPLVARGARETESPAWMLGFGIPRPEGLVDSGGGSIGQPDRIVPMFGWWDETQTRFRVAAADVDLKPGRDYNLTIVLSGGSAGFFLNPTNATSAPLTLLSGSGLATAVPSAVLSTPAHPIYFGRCYTRAPNIRYASGFDRKHAYMGKLACTVDNTGATTIGVWNEQLAFAGASSTAYVGYRVRVRTGTDAGKVYAITAVANQTNDATITFTLDAASHAIAISNVVDIVPPMEPFPCETTVQEVRFWRTAQLPQTFFRLSCKKALTSKLGRKPHENPLHRVAGLTTDDLMAYWPLDDDGGTIARELIGSADAIFAPSVLAIADQNVGSAGRRAAWLDGETSALRVQLGDNPNFKRNLIRNLGHVNEYFQPWNFCFRVQLYIGAELDRAATGATTDRWYEVLFSLGSPTDKTVALEARLYPLSGGAMRLAMLCPDGVVRELTGYDIPIGRWLNLIVGIENVENDAADRTRHYLYVQRVEADLRPEGDITTVLLPRTQIMEERDSTLLIGASCAGIADRGSQANNHAMIGMSVLGYGFHPAHSVPLTSPITVPTTAITDLNELIRFDAVLGRDECVPPITGAEGGATVAADSRTITVVGGDNLPRYLNKFPAEIEHVELTLREEGRADRDFPDHPIIQSVSGMTVTLSRDYIGYALSGAEMRVVVWEGYTDFATSEPGSDVDLNTAREDGQNFAITSDVFADVVAGPAGFDVAIDPAYEFLSPHRVTARWGFGVVRNLDARISGLHQYADGHGHAVMVGVAGGSVYEINERWRRGDAFGRTGWSWAFLHVLPAEQERREEKHRGYPLLAANTRTCCREAIHFPFGGFGGTDTAQQWEVDTWLPELDGRRTLLGAATLSVGNDSTGKHRWLVKKNLHLYVSNGFVYLESADPASGMWVIAKTTRSVVRAKTWHRVQAEAVWNGSSELTAIRFKVDGIAVASSTTSSGTINAAAVPQLAAPYANDLFVGAIGDPGTMEFVDGLGGLVGGVAYSLGYRYGDTAGVGDPYTPLVIDRTTEAGVDKLPLDEGAGERPTAHDSGGSTIVCDYLGSTARHVGSGLGGTRDNPVTFASLGDVLYLNNFATRPHRYDLKALTAAGIRPPVGRFKKVIVARSPLRIEDAGAELPANVGAANRADLNSANPHLRTFAGAAPTPAAADIGCLVYIPPDPDMGGAGHWPCGYIGLIRDFTPTGTIGYRLEPVPFTQQLVANLGELAWTAFREGRDPAFVATLNGYKRVIQNLKSTTPWGPTRLLPSGHDDCDTPRHEDLTTVGSNAGCFHFRGNQFVETPAFEVGDMPVARGKVLDVKGYLRLDDINAFGDDRQIIVEQGTDDERPAWRLAVVNGGRLEFSFFDKTLGAVRTITTVGKCVTANQWYYVRLRYRFKEQGAHKFDTTGGWEPDLRWLRKSGAGTHYQKANNFRDGLWVYACEGLHEKNAFTNTAQAATSYVGDVDEGAPCAIFTLPGSQSQVGATIAAGTKLTHNHSHMLLNGGLLKSAPYLTPERGDGLFPATGASAAVDSGVEMTIAVTTIQSLIAGISTSSQLTLPSGFALPRTCSMNRDDAWNRDAAGGLSALNFSTQIYKSSTATPTENFWHATAGAGTDPSRTPFLGAFQLVGNGAHYGRYEGWAVLVRVWSVTDPNGTGGVNSGDPVDKAAGDAARVLAIVHLHENDIGESSAGGVSGHKLFVTDDVYFGGDGLGALKSGGATLVVGAKVHATIELQNGTNQSVNSTNRLVTPTLLEHGDNPVGSDDSPDEARSPVRFGGTLDQDEDFRVSRGLRGRMDDWGFLIANLASHATNIYTTDCMPPDAFFTGPADTRIQSLPRLHFIHHANVLDDVSGSVAALSTLVMRFDTLQGQVIAIEAASSHASAPNARLRRKQQLIQQDGEHRFRVTYYDPDQDVESAPGPETVVQIDHDELQGDEHDAGSTFAISGIPVSGDRRPRLWRRIYKSLPGGSLFFLFSEVRDNSTVGLTPSTPLPKLVTGRQLDFTNNRPPICRAIKATEDSLLYIGVDDAPNVVAISQAFKPEHVDGTQIVYLESGRGGPLIGADFLRGTIVTAKRNALFVTQPAGSVFRSQRVGDQVGSLSANGMRQLDEVLFFPSQKGVYVFSGNQRAFPASDVIEEFYRRGLDLRAMELAHGAAYLDRGEYLLSVVRRGHDESRTILAATRRFDQFGNPYQVWTVLEPNTVISALAEYEDEANRVSRAMVASGAYAAVFDEGNGVLRTDETAIFGPHSTYIGSGGQGWFSPDPASGWAGTQFADGLRGVPFIVYEMLDKDGVALPNTTTFDSNLAHNFSVLAEGQVADDVLTNAPSYLYYDRYDNNFAGMVGKQVVFGAQHWHWRSKWFGADHGESVKAWTHLDIFMDQVADVGGIHQPVFVEVYRDFQTTPAIAFRAPVDTGHVNVPITSLRARLLQFRVRGIGFSRPNKLHRFDLRGLPHDGWKSQRRE